MTEEFSLTRIHQGEMLLEEATDKADQHRRGLLESIIDLALEDDSIIAALECIAYERDAEALEALRRAMALAANRRAITYYSDAETRRRDAEGEADAKL